MIRKTGALKLNNNKWEFTVWAPLCKTVQMEFAENGVVQELQKDEFGYWSTTLEAQSGMNYRFILDGHSKRPDPASRFQPQDVHEWSQVVSHDDFKWKDADWKGIPMSEMIMYELHTGTFSPEGTFGGIIPKIDYLLELGINAIEIMPVSQFPGNRNWGYDGVYPYAVQNSYGGPAELKKLVDACHQKGMAVILDVVYNHMGPEGNYLPDFGPYFTDKYSTPWGKAINFDDAHSDHVRHFFIGSALMWLRDYHLDGLRLDAVHAILDYSATPFLKQMRQEVDKLEKETGRKYNLIAESDMNDVRLLDSYSSGGYNLDAQWTDDFHHSVHTLLTGEDLGYYSDFGKVEDLAKSFRQGFVYDGRYSGFRKRTVGSDPTAHSPSRFVVCIQNHDQVGNRMLGERLSQLVSFEKRKLAAAIMLISPFVTMLFMGEEYDEDSPFQYFVSHGDPELVEAVRQGRKGEFESFEWQGEVPDPQSAETFKRSKLKWDYDQHPQKALMLRFYKHLIALRKEGAFTIFSDDIDVQVNEENKMLGIIGRNKEFLQVALINLSESEKSVKLPGNGTWQKVLATSDEDWNGPGGTASEMKADEQVVIPASSLIIYKSR